MIFAKFGKKKRHESCAWNFYWSGEKLETMPRLTGNISLLLVNKMREIDDKGCMRALAL